MKEKPSVYDDLDVPSVINGTGHKTRISGSLMRDRAADAMRDAARGYVRISDLQARASELIADLTGAEAGYVTSGASAGLTLAAAACIAGTDFGAMASLPDTGNEPNEIVIPRTHRNGYDHALRVSGAEIVDVGGNDQSLGTGSESVEPWEIEAAITDATVAVGYLAKPSARPPLDDVVQAAHDNDVPVVVDAAAELPPATNLTRFVEQGADVVVFSGGKAIRGPQTTGIVAGRRRLIESIALQHLDMHTAAPVWDPPTDLVDDSDLTGVPRHGLGRGFKVGKEELVGAIYALKEFVDEDHGALQAEWNERAHAVAASLDSSEYIDTAIDVADKTHAVPTVVATIDEGAADVTAAELLLRLRREDPRVFLGSDHLEDGTFTVNPVALTDEEAEYVVERALAHLGT